MMKTISKFVLATAGLLLSINVHAEVILSSIFSAENSLLTSNNRLFISGDRQMSEGYKSNGVWLKKMVPAFNKNGVQVNCDFLGLTEMKSTQKVYAVCADSVYIPITAKRLFVLDLNDANSAFREVGTIANATLLNGLTDDEQGNLYVADSAILGPGKIIKLALNGNGFTQTTALQYLLQKPNGLKFDTLTNRLYASLDPVTLLGESQIVRYDLMNGQLQNGRKIFSRFTFLDDFNLVKDGVVVADFLAGSVIHVQESTGNILNQTGFIGPSSVSIGKPLLFNNGDLIVTEKLTGSVHAYTNNWGLVARE